MDGRGNGRRAAALTTATLDARRPYKPLDVGNGIVSGSVGANGRWLSLGTAHHVHGRIELTTAPAFTGDRYQQSAVRAYRASLADPGRPTFGFDLLDVEPSFVTLAESSFPRSVVERPQGRFEVTTFAPEGRAGAVQVLRIAARAKIVGPTWGGALRLGRAEYTQLTPGGALPPAATNNTVELDGAVFSIDDRSLGAAAAFAQDATLMVDDGAEAWTSLAVAFATDRASAVSEARALAADGRALLERAIETRRRLWSGVSLASDERTPERRAVAYAIDCAASVVDGGVAVLADHQILPLVWTRDAYYVCRALLAVGARVAPLRAVVDGFVRWTFDVAQRIDGWWPRASLASGQAKDPAFQLDQQLFPLLLVADHARLTGDLTLRDRYATSCAETIGALLAKRTSFGLIRTDETPADDPLAQPYHFSSHVLLHHVLERFGHAEASAVREMTARHFTSEGRFAYAVGGPDGAEARHYHDANDLPTVFAPGWGFCAGDDPRWRETIAFAWSEKNEAYFGGRLPGLGSVHTRHPWPLGDLQEVVVARVLNDEARAKRALLRLDEVETWDGLLPEAYDEATGAVASRHWFAWPAAVRALLRCEPALIAP